MPTDDRDNGANPDPSAVADLITVEVLGLPLDVAARAQEHHDGLMREFVLIRGGLDQEPEQAPLPARLLDLMTHLSGQYSPFTVEQDAQLADALASGEATVDLTFRVPAGIAQAVQALDTMLDEADDYCRRGDYLLTLATPPELVAYRRWLLFQFADQAAGAAPTRWSSLSS